MIGRTTFASRAAADAARIGGFLRAAPRLHLLRGMKGNIGDHLIWRGTDTVLADQRLSPHPIGIDEVDAHRGGGWLVVPGSGAFSASYHEWLPDLVRGAARRFDRVVVLPSEFDTTVPVVAAALSQPNVFPFARDFHSYRAAARCGRAAFAIDLAVHCPGFDHSLRVAPPSPEGGALVALRTDHASIVSAAGLGIDTRANRDIAAIASDLDEYLRVIRSSSHVTTDRLHVMVTAVLSGVPVTYLDAAAQKLSRYVHFTFGDELGDRARQAEPAWMGASLAEVAR